MGVSSEVHPSTGGSHGEADGYAVAGQTSFEQFSSLQGLPPDELGARSISVEGRSKDERMVVMALLDVSSSRDGGGGERCGSSTWPGLISTGGEEVPDFQDADGPKARKPPTYSEYYPAAVREDAQLLRSTSGGSSINVRGPNTEEQKDPEMQELEDSMPTKPPFGGFRPGSRNAGACSSGKRNSRKAKLAASRDDLSSEAGTWRMEASISLSCLLSNSGSGSSGGGGPGVIQGSSHAGGGSINNSGGGGASWECGPHPGAGGAATTHDGVRTNKDAKKIEFAPKPARQQSFNPDGDINAGSLVDLCVMPNSKPQPQATRLAPPPRLGFENTEQTGRHYRDNVSPADDMIVRDWKARVPPDRSGAKGGGYDDHNNDEAYPAPPPKRHMAFKGPIAPPPTPRVVHEKKPSFGLLASMIPDISKFGSRSSAPTTCWAPTVGGVAVADRFSPAEVSPSIMTIGDHVGDEWTREAALARYRHKRKRRALAKVMRENDPNLKEQNKSRIRPRNKGKFEKTGSDFVSIRELQRAGYSRSISGEVPTPPARDSTPPPRPICSKDEVRDATTPPR